MGPLPAMMALQLEPGSVSASGFTLLEIAKLAVSALTPIVVLFLGVVVHRFSKRLEHAQWANQKLIEKRLAVYDAMAPQMNDLLCFCTFVGRWQTLTPPEILDRKRDLDRQFYVSAPLFSQKFACLYQTFMDTCFKTYGGHATHARLRIGLEYRQQHVRDWRPEWTTYFVSPSDVDKGAVRLAYAGLMGQFATELGIRTPRTH